MKGYLRQAALRKREWTVVVTFLLAGAIANVVVAWGCFYSLSLFGIPPVYHRYFSSAEAATIVAEHTGATVTNAEGGEDRAIGIWAAFVTDQNDSRRPAVYLTTSGWPLKTMQGRLVHLNGQSQSHWIKTTSHSYIPLQPIWLGFVVNTLFYTTVLWLLVRGSFALRRYLRRKRGRCAACAYPIGDSPVCSECGRPIAQRSEPSSIMSEH